MKTKLYIKYLIFILLSSCSKQSEDKFNHCKDFQNEKAELIALGSYPNYYYNLANELNNAGRINLAIEAYINCIKTSNSQTFVEDAMYNVSILYFETNQDSRAYTLMDSLIIRKYTWLNWYKTAKHPFFKQPNYLSRLEKIDSINALINNPINCNFHYQDVSNFITAFKKSQTNWNNAPSYFYNDYFSKASKALYFYQKFKIQSSSHQFAYRIEDKEAYFQSIIPNLTKLNTQEKVIRNHLNEFKKLYPNAIFPDIYYVVGCFNAGGTSSPFGLIIGAEMHTKTEASNLTNFNNWEKKVVRDFSNLPLITLHELVHIQQNNNYNNLLGNAIYEGAADFISTLVCGSHINEHVHDWANKNENEVWHAFKKEMYGENTQNWIGNADRAKGKPADLGYYVGFKICESYYNNQTDKKKAIKEILSITNWNEFYLKSRYMK
ncbi:hypothetical protein PW52_12855 [Tamlana sedimentorum]|uniref:Uncharacterized protein n=1 Tax=Neotamlana sedimentorum TaxID=1435349 RepID=A0A0D7W785_9FLAO|nr:DUF2268 domain-containing putative Zn-dependent protease [Tamlana sedimentorum]KJD34980.1 hypothetical protein PW52_12855 [Tamlana sedimentorum]